MKCFSGYKKILCLTAALIAAAALALPQTAGAEQPVIRVGYADLGGVTRSADGSHSGYTVDYLNELSRHTGWRYEYIPGTWAECVKMMQDGDIDLLGMVRQTEERMQYFLYSEMSVAYDYTVLCAAGDRDIYYQEYDAFDGLTVGVVARSIHEQSFAAYAGKHGLSCRLVAFETEKQLESALEQGEIDLLATSGIRLLPGMKVVDQFEMVPTYFVTGRNNREFMRQLDSAMQKLRIEDSSIAARLSEKYYGVGYAAGDLLLTREEQEYINSVGPITVRGFDGRQPLGYMSAGGSFVGILADYLNALGDISGLEFSHQRSDIISFEQNVDAISQQGGAMLFIDMPTENLAQPVYRSKPLFETGLSYVRRAGDDGPAGDGCVFAVNREMAYVGDMLLARNGNFVVDYYDTAEDCMEAVADGRADITVQDEFVSAYLLQKPRFADALAEVSGEKYTDGMCLYAPEQHRLLISIIDKTLNYLSEEERLAAVTDAMLAHPYEYKLEDMLYIYGGWIVFSAALFGVILVLVTTLHRKITNAAKQKRENEELQQRLRLDELTGVLYNRRGFFEKAREMIDSSDGEVGIVRINVCNFKLINDLYGQENGDRLLCEMGRDLKALGERHGFIAGRFTGDHFYLCVHREDFEAVGFTRRAPAPWLGMDVALSYGVYPVGGQKDMPISAMCDRADMANASNAQSADELIRYYSDDERQRLLREQEIENEMEKALEERQFCIYIQPKYDLATGRISGGEALVRWLHPQKGLIPPFQFIGLFERNGFIRKLDFYIWEECCRFLSGARKRGLPSFPLSVNVSRVHFYGSELAGQLQGLLEKYDIRPDELELEITETVCAEDSGVILSKCRQLRQMGFKIAMDDFGSGYSSLNMLKEMPIDTIKMDLRFLAGAGDEHQEDKGRSILRTLIELAHDLELNVVVEGVETRQQKDFIAEIGGCSAQGYYFSRPIAAEQYAGLIANEPAAAPGEPKPAMAMTARERLIEGQRASLLRMVRGGSNIYGYLIPERRGILSEQLARRYGVPEAIDNMPEWMVSQGNVGEDSVDVWLGLFAAADRGEKNGSGMAALRGADGSFGIYWLRLDIFADSDGRPFMAIITFDDFTEISERARVRDNDISALLQATHKVFPELLTINLTRGSYRMLHHDGATTLGVAREGDMDDMVAACIGGVAQEDRERFLKVFSRQGLEKAFAGNDSESAQLVYRRLGRDDGRTYWFETTVVRQNNSADGDVLLLAMSRHLDARKAEEARLREQLRMQAEELQLTMSKMGKLINYYDVATSTFTMADTDAKDKGIPTVMKGFPESFIADSKDRLSPESANTIQEFYNAIRRGEPSGSCDYLISSTADKEVWMHLEFAAIFDSEGKPARAVVTAENVTNEHAQAAENRRLKENERILTLIAQHSDRIICHYDVKSMLARRWDEETCRRCALPHLCEMPYNAVLDSGGIMPESTGDMRRMFDDIHAGVPNGSIKMRTRTADGKLRWFDMRYSTICDQQGEAVSALISHIDITERYEHELAYLRQMQTIDESENHLGMMEVDLTADTVERQGGKMALSGSATEGMAYTGFSRRMVQLKLLEADREEGLRFYSKEHLLSQYNEGMRHLTRVWQMRLSGGELRWVRTDLETIADPYTGHVKAFFRMWDVTAIKESQLEIQRRSELDGMTGLLNRSTAEERIRDGIAKKENPGILILLDLDDLKGINDNFGHTEGDKTIIALSNTLKSHFRDSDIIGRAGGDEFLLYLPGAAANRDVIVISLTALLRKLSAIPVGTNGRRLCCSIGCAVEGEADDSFETLYNKADTALYHVKRSGKNNFAFYSPEMEQEGYSFKEQKLFSLEGKRKFESGELQHLLGAIASFYQLVLSVNVEANGYYLLDEIADGVFSKVPTFGVLDSFVELTASRIHPDDVGNFTGSLSREALTKAHQRGEKNVRCAFRFLDRDGYRPTEATAIFYTNDNGELCDFTLVRWAD